MENEKKLALVLFGSPHKNGNTNKMLEIFKSNINGYEFAHINAYDLNIKPCIDCKHCQTSPSCIYDDFKCIDILLNKADLLIVASPIYNLSFPAPLKAIFDRMQIYYSTRFYKNIKPPIKKVKRGIVLITCGSNDDLGMKIISRQLHMIFSIINTTVINEILWKNIDKNEDISNIEKEVILAAKNITSKNNKA